MKKKSPRNLILIGCRGTGKSTVGALLAARLGWPWVDADPYLEAKYGRTIRDIFAAEGEDGFREKEATVLAELCCRTQHVFATGGGAVLRPYNRALLRQSGVVVWLTADAPTIGSRLQADATTADRRPALTALGSRAEIEHLLAVREPLYRQCADLVVDTVGRSPEDVTDEILNHKDFP